MLKFKLLCSIALMLAFFAPHRLHPQETPQKQHVKELKFSLGTELVSRYVWRGVVQDLHPHIQGNLNLAHKGLSFDVWASSGINSSFSEIDLSLAYNTGFVTFALVDYFVLDENNMADVDFFRFKNKPGGASNHALEAAVILENFSSLPLRFSAGTFFLGDDRDVTNKQRYSTYLEMAYTRDWDQYNFQVFLGGTPFKGLYADKAALTNIGMKAARKLAVGNEIELLLSSSLIVNPDAKQVYVVFGIGL
jgi:hypothetical protein